MTVVSVLIWAMIFFLLAGLVINKWWMITGTGHNKDLIMNLDCRISYDNGDKAIWKDI